MRSPALSVAGRYTHTQADRRNLYRWVGTSGTGASSPALATAHIYPTGFPWPSVTISPPPGNSLIGLAVTHRPTSR